MKYLIFSLFTLTTTTYAASLKNTTCLTLLKNTNNVATPAEKKRSDLFADLNEYPAKNDLAIWNSLKRKVIAGYKILFVNPTIRAYLNLRAATASGAPLSKIREILLKIPQESAQEATLSKWSTRMQQLEGLKKTKLALDSLFMNFGLILSSKEYQGLIDEIDSALIIYTSKSDQNVLKEAAWLIKLNAKILN